MFHPISHLKGLVSAFWQLKSADLYKRISDLEKELAEAKRHHAITDTLRYDAPFYVSTNSQDLYCARCREVNGKAIHVIKTDRLQLRRRVYECPECRQE